MNLTIPKNILDELLTAAEDVAPIEACGMLSGKNETVTHFYPLTNIDNTEEHFSMIPEEQFKAVKDMRAKNEKLLAIWHSHPATPPRMSEEDLKLAYTPDVFYVILSLAVPKEEMIRGYKISEDKPEPINIIIV